MRRVGTRRHNSELSVPHLHRLTGARILAARRTGATFRLNPTGSTQPPHGRVCSPFGITGREALLLHADFSPAKVRLSVAGRWGHPVSSLTPRQSARFRELTSWNSQLESCLQLACQYRGKPLPPCLLGTLEQISLRRPQAGGILVMSVPVGAGSEPGELSGR